MSEELILNILCKQGHIQITAAGILQIKAPFPRGIIWSIPAQAITQVLNPKQGFASVSVAFYSKLGSYQCDTVSRSNFAKLQAALQPYISGM